MLKLALSLIFVAGAASAQTAKPTTTGATAGAAGGTKSVGPCEQIKLDCEGKGYVAGEAGQGKGLWWDCMCPLIASNFPEPSKNVLSVPSDSGLAASCRTHPHGQNIMTRCAGMLAKKNAKAASKGQPAQPGH